MKRLIIPKRLQLDKTSSSMILVVGVASSLSVFFLVAMISLNSKRIYQQRVISVKQKAVKQLKENISSVNTLATSYQDFINKDPNVIGGIPKGTGEKDGDNAKIILDALPSKYDFPALATSIDKLISQKNLRIDGINGNDDEIAQKDSKAPVIVGIPFTVSVSGSYASIVDLIKSFENSIRPIKIENITLSGKDNSLNCTIKATTYYQPTKSINIKLEEVK